jgi:parallel beta-helix repeat protein
LLEGFTVQDAKGDAIKTMHVTGITFRNVKAEWTGIPGPDNGGYGLYPVQCERVLIDQCEAIGASDAGIYVGQSKDIVVKNSKAFHNVAGIEIENSLRAEVLIMRHGKTQEVCWYLIYPTWFKKKVAR